MADQNKELVNLISFLYNKNSTHVYDALVKIRSVYLKLQGGIIRFCEKNGIKAILNVIHRHPVLSENSEETTVAHPPSVYSTDDHLVDTGTLQSLSGEKTDHESSKQEKSTEASSTDIPKLYSSDDNLKREKIKALEARNIRMLDIVFSILANCCTVPVARDDVIKNKGVNIIVSVLKLCDVDSISNRVCRTIANLAQTSGNSRRILKYDVLETIVKRLNDCENDDSKQTYIRTLRLLGDSTDGKDQITEVEGIRPIAENIKSDNEALVNVSIRALNDLSQGCTSAFGRQFLEADCLQQMLKLVDHENQSIKKHALSTLFHVCEQECVRPSFGNAGGISTFIDLAKTESVPAKSMPIINCICLCCQEVVNRMKIRESSGLELLLLKLKDKSYSRLHPRIISALVHFCTNEVGMKILLENGLVDCLMKQLELCATIKVIDIDCILKEVYSFYEVPKDEEMFINCDEQLNSKDSKKAEDVLCTSAALNPSKLESLEQPVGIDIHVEANLDTTVSMEDSSRLPEMNIEFASTAQLSSDLNEEDTCPIEKESNTELVPETDNLTLQGLSPTRHEDMAVTENQEDVVISNKATNDEPVVRYSIDSPTYRVIDWNSVSYFSGQKCIENFDPPTPYQLSSSPSSSPSYDTKFQEPYSPLSVQSFLSSSVCSVTSAISPAYSSFSDLADEQPSDMSGLEESRYSPFIDDANIPDTIPQSLEFDTSAFLPQPEIAMETDMVDAPNNGPPDEKNFSECSISTDTDTDARNRESVSDKVYCEAVAGTSNILPAEKSSNCSKSRLIDTSQHRGKTQWNSSTLGSLDFKPPLLTQKSFKPTVDLSFNKEFHYREVTKPEMPDEVLRMVLFSKECIDKTKVPNDKKESPITTGKFRKRTVSARRDSCSSGTSSNVTKGKPKRQKHENPIEFSVRNILYILSSISHMESVEKYLLTLRSINTLLSYSVLTLHCSHTRCWRILDRLTKNLDCFQFLLEMNFPSMIFHLLCQPGIKTTVKILGSQFKFDSECHGVSLSEKELPASNEDNKTVRSSHTDRKLELKAVDLLNEKGHEMLDNLMNIAQGGFGRGVIYSGLMHGTAMNQIMYAVNASYIARSPFLLKKIFIEFKSLEKLIDGVLNCDNTDSARELHSIAYILHRICDINANKNRLFQYSDCNKNRTEHTNQCFYEQSRSKHDVSFVCTDGSVVTADRELIQKRSEVFSAMLGGNFSESNKSSVTLPHVSRDVFIVYLHFIYNCANTSCDTIHADFDWNMCIQLIGIADKFLSPMLKDFIVPKLVKQLSIHLLPSTWQYAVFYKCEKLLETSLLYMFTCKPSLTDVVKFLTRTNETENRKDIFDCMLKTVKNLL